MKPRNPFALAALLGPLVFGTLSQDSQGAYEIKRGDTLTKIAIAKYGDIEKWKEIFDLNKENIRDPHWIYPGQRLRLMPQEKLTFVPVRERAPWVASSKNTPLFRKRSQEWRLLPKQSWEKFVFNRDPMVDSSGIDRRSSVGARFTDKTLSPMAIAPDRIPVAGEIIGSRSDYSQMSLGETVLIRADETLQVGTTYSVTGGPEKLSSSRDGRVGFAYMIQGKVRIIGVRDGIFIGTLTASYHPIERGSLLIPNYDSIPIPNPIPCTSPLNASAMMPAESKKSLSLQQKLIFMDVGNADGVQPGMIFRHYMNRDPYTRSKFPTRDFMIESEVMAISVQEQFSIGLILQSRSGIRDEDELVGLTDLKDFDQNQGLQSVLQDHAPAPTMDELDRLDSTDGLGEKETQELHQLENWSKQVPSEGTGAGLPEDEIKREVVTPSKGSVPNIGEESAPNDASGSGIPKTPTTAPESGPEAAPPDVETLPAPAPEALPAAPTASPAPSAAPTPSPTPSPTPAPDSSAPAAPPPSIDDAIN